MKTQVKLNSEEVDLLLEYIKIELNRIFEYVRPSDIASQVKFGQLKLLQQVISEAKSNFENTPDDNNVEFSKN